MKKMKKTKKNWLRGMAMALTLAITLAGTAPSMPAQAAAKNITVKVKSPKEGADLYKGTLCISRQRTVQLSVKGFTTKKVRGNCLTSVYKPGYGYEPVYEIKTKRIYTDITKKATYKSSRPKVVSVNRKGRLTAKSSGTATLTVKYAGKSKKLKVVVKKNHKHQWKAHWKTVTLVGKYTYCSCGHILPDEHNKEFIEHIWSHNKNRETGKKDEVGGNYIYAPCYFKLKYIDYYKCGCGSKKAGLAEPEQGHNKLNYKRQGYKVLERFKDDGTRI